MWFAEWHKKSVSLHVATVMTASNLDVEMACRVLLAAAVDGNNLLLH